MTLSDSLVSLVEQHLGPKRRGPKRTGAAVPLLLELIRIAKAGLPWRAIDSDVAQFVGARERFMRWRARNGIDMLLVEARNLPSLNAVDQAFLLDLGYLDALVARPRSKPGKPWIARNPRKPYPKNRKSPTKA
jgi:hypothetical protein